ncbi:hypothetical protein OESDEN_15580 [Oesophagostomum dentatum]|uniref:Uncharacterized protein n=1 Tax=Oesophagostomum dentatum TaxID=61180 RepID=A0A0B1SHB7_OESDE|nr:hypothetical protein OESDEN_15580 [Oesophagostomum dentatum]
MSNANSVVNVFQNLFSNHGSTLLNAILIVTTIGGQSIIRKLTFSCPCGYPLNMFHSLVFMFGPSLALFVIAICCVRMCDKYTYVQHQYVETYKMEETSKFEQVAKEHASQLAERNARAFFNQKDWTKRDWDWVSGVAEVNNPMFARLRLIAAEKTKTTMYTPLQLWNDHKVSGA